MKFLLSFLLALFAVSAQAQTNYYICDCASGATSCTPGNSGNGATGPSDARVDVPSNATINGWAAGSKLLFCRGGKWDRTVAIQIQNLNATPTNPITLDSYEPPGYAGPVKPWLSITAGAESVIAFTEGGVAPGTPDGGYVVQNLKIEMTPDNFGHGVFGNRGVHNVKILNNEFSRGGVNSVAINGAEHECDRWTVRGNSLVNVPGQGFLFACNNSLIENNYQRNVGYGDAVFNHPFYFGCAAQTLPEPCVNLTVRNNLIEYPNNTDTTGGEAGVCGGAVSTMHGWWEGVTFYNNFIKIVAGGSNSGCFGIQINAPPYGSYEGFFDVVIDSNTILNAGGTAIDLSSVVRGLVQNNMIIQEGGADLVGVTAPRAVRNTTVWPYAPFLANEVTRDIIIRNNSIHFATHGQYSGGIQAALEGTGYVVDNNLITFAGDTGGSNDHFCFYIFESGPPASFTSFDYNICYDYGTSTPFFWGFFSQASLASFIAAGYGANNQQVDPNITNSPSTADPIIKIGAGGAVGESNPSTALPLAFKGYKRTGVPDVGAYQFGSNPP